jgi:hypothetical protein
MEASQANDPVVGQRRGPVRQIKPAFQDFDSASLVRHDDLKLVAESPVIELCSPRAVLTRNALAKSDGRLIQGGEGAFSMANACASDSPVPCGEMLQRTQWTQGGSPA